MKRYPAAIRHLVGTVLLTGIPVMTIGVAAGASPRLTPGMHTDCKPWATLRLGHYEVNNNVWGRGAIRSYSQCIHRMPESQSATLGNVGWTWKWPRSHDGVKAFPSILFGRKPWNNYSTSPVLPQSIAQLGQLAVSYDITSKSTGAVNLLLESWITRAHKAKQRDRVGELAIHLSQQRWPGQAGRYVETVTLDGIPFDFYIEPKMHVPGDNHTWAYYGFVNKGKPLMRTTIHVEKFVNYLLARGHIRKTHYLASIELGNEVDYGKGRTDVHHFSVKAGPRP